MKTKLPPLNKFATTLLTAICLSVTPGRCEHSTGNQNPLKTRYLLFQIFSYGGPDSRVVFPPQGDFELTVSNILQRIGDRGDERNKLGFCLGPLTLSHSDSETLKLIRDGFQIAKKNNLAIAFHIDDQMFWQGRKDLGGNETIEWLDWKGKPSTGRRLDWSEHPTRIAPQLCLNSQTVKNAVVARARLIGEETRKQVDQLKSEGKEHLFAGIIVGWESMIGCDFATGKALGYHALVNRGFNAARQPEDRNSELAKVIKDFVELWAKQLVVSGAPKDKLFSHIAFGPQGVGQGGANNSDSMGFAIPDVAFSNWYRPGFSLYPMEETMEKIQEPLARHNNPSWAMAEGTNVVPNGMPGESTMETYLGKLFNHGAVLANIFSWGIGGDAERERNFFRRATENQEAIAAYRKFLRGEKLVERPRNANAFSVTHFRQKIDTIQKRLPAWVNGMPARAQQAQTMMERLDHFIKTNNFRQANDTADEILRLLQSHKEETPRT